MHFIAITLWCVIVAVVYGIIHDQITARICIEHFTIGHPRLIDSQSPTVLGLLWGVLATWWMGVILGFALACIARIGRRPKLTLRQLVRPTLMLVAVVSALAIIAGISGMIVSQRRWMILLEPLASRVPEDKHVAFLTCGWAHSASYIGGLLGGIVFCIRTWRVRGRAVRSQFERVGS
jgi:hypothetical protein